MPDGQVVFQIEGDNRSVKQALTETTSIVERESRKWDQDTAAAGKSMESGMVSSLKAIGAAAIAAKVGQTLLSWGRDAIAAASDLSEVQNVVDTVFGEGAAQIQNWADKAGQSFGLTETQAKRFTSTLGAMMKSAGLAGPEIITMSTDLAGLAADMASFYNMDFDTAFQKIRSGISGETEPLKQLGINMSVANLEAFALQQGITKAFDKMSQGEQTLLRYQYLMQATADAQGDFARTADGYANASRRVEAAMETIKTKGGQLLMQVIEPLTSGIANLLSSLTATPQKTVLDQFKEIDLETEQKLAQIRATAEEANTLIGVLEQISATTVQTARTNSLVSFVNSFAGDITSLDKAMQAAKAGDLTGTINGLADSLSTQLGGSPEQWNTLLNAISTALPGATDAALTDEGQTAAWMAAAAAAADDLGDDYSQLWASLLQALGNNAGAVVSAFANAGNPGSIIQSIAEGANILKANSVGTWTGLLNTLKKVDGLQNLFGDSSAAGNVASLANALSGNAPDTTKAQAWETFLGALDAHADALTTLTGTDVDSTKAWLSGIAEAAKQLDPNDAAAWDTLLSNFVGGLPGLENTDAGSAFFEAMAQNFLAMGTDSEQARAGLAALGLSTDQINTAQTEWLETCRRLVQTIPGLSDIINLQTGEVQGGADAVREYVTEWQSLQDKIALWGAIDQKQQALQQKYSELPGLEIDMLVAQNRLRKNQAAIQALFDKYGIQGYNGTTMDVNFAESYHISKEDIAAYNSLMQAQEGLQREATRTTNAYHEQKAAYDEAKEAIAEEQQILAEEIGTLDELTGSTDAATEATRELTDAEKEAAKAALDTANNALSALAQYTKQVHDATAQQVAQTVKGFTAMAQYKDGMLQFLSPAEQARNKLKALTQQMAEYRAAGKDASGLESVAAEAENSIPSIQNMTEALESQIQYMAEYKRAMADAAARGVDADILAWLSDGSVESFDYLRELANGTGDIEQLNQKWREAQAASADFTNSLTQQKLSADETFTGLVESANEAIAALDMQQGAQSAVETTVQGIVTGLQNKLPEVETAVNNILNTIAQLQGMGDYGLGFNGFQFSAPVGLGSSSSSTDVNVQTSVYLDGREISNNTASHMADSMRAQERAGVTQL